MYKSPIQIINGQIQTHMEGEVLRVVQQYGIDVDKKELLLALQYDRNQYFAGYRDAISDHNLVNVVRCKDCKHQTDGMCVMDFIEDYPWVATKDDDFCSRGERKENV